MPLPRPLQWPPHHLGREATTLPGRGQKTFLISSFSKALAEVRYTQTPFWVLRMLQRRRQRTPALMEAAVTWGKTEQGSKQDKWLAGGERRQGRGQLPDAVSFPGRMEDGAAFHAGWSGGPLRALTRGPRPRPGSRPPSPLRPLGLLHGAVWGPRARPFPTAASAMTWPFSVTRVQFFRGLRSHCLHETHGQLLRPALLNFTVTCACARGCLNQAS